MNYVKLHNKVDDSAVGNSMMHPNPVKIGHRLSYPAMKVKAIQTFSSFCVILGILSILFQFAALLINQDSFRPYVNFPADLIAHGVWAGLFYLTAGSLGIAATRKRTKSLLVGTVVMSALSIAISVIVSPPSGIAAGLGLSTPNTYTIISRPNQDCHVNYGSICDAWLQLEWSLFIFHILAFVCNITLTVLASMALCTCNCCSDEEVMIPATSQPTYIVAANGQPLLVQQQPETYQVAYNGQEALFHKS